MTCAFSWPVLAFWGLGVAPKKPRLSWAKSAVLKADGLKKKLEDARVDLVAAGDATEIYATKTPKSTQIKLMMFLFLKTHWRWGMPRFSRAQKNKTLPSLQIQKQFTSFQLNISISWWICSKSEIPLWTFPIFTICTAKANLLWFHLCAVGRWHKHVPNAEMKLLQVDSGTSTPTGCLGSGCSQ